VTDSKHRSIYCKPLSTRVLRNFKGYYCSTAN